MATSRQHWRWPRYCYVLLILVGRADFLDELLLDYVVHTAQDPIVIVAAFGHDNAAGMCRRFGLIS